LSRRYKALYGVIQEFVAFLGQHMEALGSAFRNDHLYEDKSLFKAQGSVWHQSDRAAGRIPAKLRHLDAEASWGKSAYHGWVYGYAGHLTCNSVGFPELVQVETASVSENQVSDEKAPEILLDFAPDTLSADNSYTQATRIRQWAKHGVALLTAAVKWIKGRYAEAYHRFIQEPDNAQRLKQRRTAIEPVFDLLAKVIGATTTTSNSPFRVYRRIGNGLRCSLTLRGASTGQPSALTFE